VGAFAFTASAAAVFQSLLGFAFPLSVKICIPKSDTVRATYCSAGLAIIIGIPFSVWIWFKGAEIRKRSVAWMYVFTPLAPVSDYQVHI